MILRLLNVCLCRTRLRLQSSPHQINVNSMLPHHITTTLTTYQTITMNYEPYGVCYSHPFDVCYAYVFVGLSVCLYAARHREGNQFSIVREYKQTLLNDQLGAI